MLENSFFTLICHLRETEFIVLYQEFQSLTLKIDKTILLLNHDLPLTNNL